MLIMSAYGRSIALYIGILATMGILINAQYMSYFDDVELPRIAIIGGGIGGATVAYKLNELFSSHLTTLDVYEHGKIGGRLQTVSINGVEYEIGGAIIHPANLHMQEFVKHLGLDKLTSNGGDNFAMFEGKENVFETSRNSWMQTAQLVWRYGLSLLTMGKHTDQFLADFHRIYKWQEERQSFTTVPNLLLSMSDEIMNATQVPLRDSLLSLGISEKVISELVLAATRTVYGQTPTNLNDFVGSLSLAGAGSGLWSVKGGNRLVPEGLLRESGAEVIKNTVTKVTNIKTDSGHPLYKVQTSDGVVKEYDVVVLAFPLIKGHSDVEFVNIDTDFSKLGREFHHLSNYIVEGVPNYRHFGYESLDQMPDIILPLDNESYYNSLERVYPASGAKTSQQVYRVFADQTLSQDQLDSLFESRKTTEVVNWYAFPEYSSDMEFVQFTLAPKLYYVNAIELAASAMEMSAIGGTNVANLILHQWMGHDYLIDNMFVIEEKHIKIEL